MPQPFSTLTSIAMPLLRDNIDTDIIIPSREMKSTGKTGLKDGLFAGWRYSEGRTPAPDFALNQPRYSNAQIILSGANFGCGSSREHAVWALHEYGFRAVIAPSFAPIFYGNCVRNGIVCAALPADQVAALAGHDGPIMIDLAAQTVRGSESYGFAIDDEPKMMLLEGLDAIDLSLKKSAEIAAFQAHDKTARPWVYLET